MSGIGHNRGPSLDGGTNWRSHCWRQARAALLPHLPIEVVRSRVRRAAELGLDYRTYAGVRATTGHDLVAFLFSSNALGLSTARLTLSAERAAKLAAIGGAGRIALVLPPLTPEAVCAGGLPLDAAHVAPGLLTSDGIARATIRAALGKLPADAVLLIGDNELERGWCAAARLAGYLGADRYFAAA